jgi:hypothetical protein
MADNFKADPGNAGWVLGWAVIRNSPWHLAGFFDNQADATVEASKLDGYEARYGSHKLGTDDFMSA